MHAVLNCSHRGVTTHFRENSLEAFLEAVDQGAEAIELDVRPCKTGELIVIHDAAFSGNGRVKHLVSNLSLQQIQTMQLKQLPIYPLETVLTQLSPLKLGSSITIFIELKGLNRHMVKTLCAVIENQVQANGYQNEQLRIIGFQFWMLKAAKKKHTDIMTGLSCFLVPGFYWLSILLASSIKADMVNPHYYLISRRFINNAKAKKLQVNAWPVNQSTTMQALIKSGIDCIMTDTPILLRTIQQHD